MKFDARTIAILKNFSTINQSILFKAGKEIATVSSGGSVMGIYKTKEELPRDAGVYDLSRLLGVLSIFDNPDIEFEETHFVIKDSRQHLVKYIYNSPSGFNHPYNEQTGQRKEPKITEFEINFKITKENFSALMKAAAMMQLPEIVIIGDKKQLKIASISAENPTGDEYVIKLEEMIKHKFKMVFPVGNLPFLTEGYDVSISAKGIGRFVGEDVQYWATCDNKQSSFEE